MKILSIVGTRPQLIKVAPIIEQCRIRRIPHVLVNTGQHYDYTLNQIFFEEFHIPQPAYNLQIKSGGHIQQIAKILSRLTPVLEKEKPSVVLVYGDTNSALGGALCTTKFGIPLGHVEAGPRCYDRSIPEEVNRTIIDHLSMYHFSPVPSAVQNLKKERIRGYLVGNVAVETLLKKYPQLTPAPLTRWSLQPGQYILATIHHGFNVDDRSTLKEIVDGLLATRETIVLPVHPRLEKNLRRFGFYAALKQVHHVLLTPPLDYKTAITLLKYARCFLTDSGGSQYEGYVLGVPTFVLRTTTEWPETIGQGCTLIPSKKTSIVRALGHAVRPRKHLLRKYDRHVSERILRILLKDFRIKK